MARPLRIECEDALYHVTSRGNARQRVFRDDLDYERRMDWLRRTVEVYGWRVHAFAMMPNHDHLFIETPRPNLAAGMQYLNGSYTSYFNRRHRLVGHLFQGRYKAILIENEGHYWEISRYIHLNPVRARLAERPEDWAWSSYGGYHRPSRRLPWVTYARVLKEFGRNVGEAVRRYRRFVAAGLSEPLDSPLDQVVHGALLGGDQFVARMQSLLESRPADRAVPQLRRLRPQPTLARIRTAVAEHFGADVSTWRHGRRDDTVARSVAAWLARCRFGYSATAVARALGYSGPGSVGQAVRRIEQEMKRLATSLGKLERQITNV